MATFTAKDGTQIYYKDWSKGHPVVFSHGTQRVPKAVIVVAVRPLMLKTSANPGGLPIEAFDKIR